MSRKLLLVGGLLITLVTASAAQVASHPESFQTFALQQYQQLSVHTPLTPQQFMTRRLQEHLRSDQLEAQRILEQSQPNIRALFSPSASDDRLLDMECSGWSAGSGQWLNDFRWDYNYSLNGVLEELKFQDWIDEDWADIQRTIYINNSSGNPTEDFLQEWDGIQWIDEFKHDYEYSVEQLLTRQTWSAWNDEWEYINRHSWVYNESFEVADTFRQWDPLNERWVNNSLSTFDYDNITGNIIYEIQQDPEGEINWVNNFKFSYSHNSAGNITERIHQNWEDGAWVNDRRDLYVYNDEEQFTAFIIENWIQGEWTNFIQQNYTFDGAGNLIDCTTQHWNGDEWENSTRSQWTFDGAMYYTELIEQFWEGGSWVNNWRSLPEWDSNGNAIDIIVQNWVAGEWRNWSRCISNYETFTGIETEASITRDFELKQNYPNPFNPSTVIAFELKIRSEVLLEIYDVAGRRIRTLIDREPKTATRQLATWDGTDESGRLVASGIYLYKLAIVPDTGARQQQTRKLVLLR